MMSYGSYDTMNFCNKKTYEKYCCCYCFANELILTAF